MAKRKDDVELDAVEILDELEREIIDELKQESIDEVMVLEDQHEEPAVIREVVAQPDLAADPTELHVDTVIDAGIATKLLADASLRRRNAYDAILLDLDGVSRKQVSFVVHIAFSALQPGGVLYVSKKYASLVSANRGPGSPLGKYVTFSK